MGVQQTLAIDLDFSEISNSDGPIDLRRGLTRVRERIMPEDTSTNEPEFEPIRLMEIYHGHEDIW